MRYVRVFVDSTAGFQPATRSDSRAGIIGTSASGPTGKFLLTKPSGDEFDSITVGSALYNGILSFYSQPNTRELWCVRMPSANQVITGMVPSPATNGSPIMMEKSRDPKATHERARRSSACLIPW